MELDAGVYFTAAVVLVTATAKILKKRIAKSRNKCEFRESEHARCATNSERTSLYLGLSRAVTSHSRRLDSTSYAVVQQSVGKFSQHMATT